MKYTVVLSCNQVYMYGLNALLNGLDYYDNPIQEVKVLWQASRSREMGEIADDFLARVHDVGFNFKVTFIDLDEFFKGTPEEGKAVPWKLRFSRWLVASKESNTVCVLGADVMVVNNLTPWFDIAAQTQYIITGENALGDYNFHSDEPKHTNNAPYADIPVFINPGLYSNLLKRVYEIGTSKPMGDMPAWYFALIEATDKIIAVPDNLWIRNCPNGDRVRQYTIKNKIAFQSTGPRSRINMIHGKYWSRKRIEKKKEAARTKQPDALPLVENNVETLYKAMRFFNTQCKLKLKWIGEEL